MDLIIGEAKLIKILVVAIFTLGLGIMYGCETVHEGAEKGGEGVGKALSVPNSASEGAAEGFRGKPESNPYNR